MLSPIRDILIIGTGNAAACLAYALRRAQLNIYIWGRDSEKSTALAKQTGSIAVHSLSEAPLVDLIIIAVADHAIKTIVIQLLRGHSDDSSPLLVHLSGSSPMSLLGPYAKRYGVMYPLMSLSAGRIVDFREVPLLIEASDPESNQQLLSLASKLSCCCLNIDSRTRLHLHLASVVACNFTNYMLGWAASLAGIHFDLLKPAIQEVLAKALVAAHPALVQTGPAQRGDQQIILKHINLLSGQPDLQQLYQQISDLIQKSAKNV